MHSHIRSGRLIRLEAGDRMDAARGLRRFVVGGISLAEGQDATWVTVTRTGRFSDPRYGDFEISRVLLEQMVRNFDAGTYGQKVFIDVAHRPQDGAAGEVLRLAVEGDRLRALVAWTEFGREAVLKRGFAYLSAEYQENWKDNETGTPHGCVLLGAGLVTRPCIKRLDPVQLSEGEGAAAVAVHPKLLTDLIQEIRTMWEKQLKALREQLLARKLSEHAVAAIVAAAAKALEAAGVTDEAAAVKVLAAFEVISLDAPGAPPISVNVSGLSAEDVRRILDEARAADAAEARQLAETADARRKLFGEHLEKVGAGLPEALRLELSAEVAEIVPALGDAAVKALAEKMAARAEASEATRELAALGWQPRGSAHIEVLATAPKKLGEMVREALKRTNAYAQEALRVPEKDGHFVSRVLAEFDRRHAPRLEAEHRALADGNAVTGDYFFPAGLQREVIREALSDLNVLQLVRTDVDPAAQGTTMIPFEVRPNYEPTDDGQVFEGQPIPRYQTLTDHELAFITPMKLGMQWTNELAHFTRRGLVNWDAVAENLAANARTIRELVSRRIANEMQRASDSYGAVPVAGESVTGQLNGANSLLKTAHFPVVRPHQKRDLKGTPQGDVEHPIVVVINSVTRAQWNGTGNQPAGIYWRPVSFNLGYIQLVDEAGEPVGPANTGTNTVGYSRVTNIVKVDLDVPVGVDPAKHLNRIIEAVGARKAMLLGQRFVRPDFLLMSPTLNDVATNAEAFVASLKRDGSDTNSQGDLARLKGLPAFGTNQPGIDLGDERMMIAPRNLLGYTISKPWSVEGAPFEVVNEDGLALGKKQIYGEEYNAIHVPTPVRGYMTGVLCYSASGR